MRRRQEPKLIDWVKEMPDNTVIAIGAVSGYIYIGKRKYLDVYLDTVRMNYILNDKIKRTFKQKDADHAEVCLIDSKAGGSGFWLMSECSEHFISELARKMKIQMRTLKRLERRTKCE